ncbi:MAG TPA: flagellar biosynthetic protein FliO [Clostridiaceae bacterium]|nr:flagellar biosynthetic protein FliO [Clostridiaceae bacterium]HHV99052.1 flagellar biosynthetic protein FliO [Clostridiaceae bacterium]
MNNGGSVLIEGLLFILAFGAILFLAYITTRLVAGKATRAMKGQYIEIVETVNLGMDKKIHLVKVDKQFILIATSGKNIEFLTNVTLENYEDPEKHEKKNNTFDFKAFLDKYIQFNKNNYTGEKNESEVGRNNTQNTIKQSLFGHMDLKGRFSGEKRKSEDENTNEKN